MLVKIGETSVAGRKLSRDHTALLVAFDLQRVDTPLWYTLEKR
ncbi:MAG TPA: hypothetical protein VFV38_31105 [Ktedonobacteraceae bacterium]|nr:hypothetical protein [Ktedonobacteraceae bacterium]